MKKVLFAMAIAGMFGFVACNGGNKAAEEPVQEATETVENAVEEICDEAAEVVDTLAQEAEQACE